MSKKVINDVISASELKAHLDNGLVSIKRSGIGICLTFIEEDDEEGNYNKKDLVSFGKYLLSKERKERLYYPNEVRGIPNLQEVYDSDLKNWQDSQN